MKSNLSIHFLLSTIVIILSASPSLQSQVPSVQIKIKEKSGFLGMGGPKYISLELSNQSREAALTDSNVNGGTYVYFLCKAAGDWQFDNDFLTEDLPNLSLGQGGKTLPVAWKAPFSAGDSSLLIGFAKEIRLNEPIAVLFKIEATSMKEQLTVPMKLWPGYSAFTGSLAGAQQTLAAANYRGAIAAFEQLIAIGEYRIFPVAASLSEERFKVFDQYYIENRTAVAGCIGDTLKDVKTKIACIDSLTPALHYVLDSLPNPALNIQPTDSAVALLLARAREAVVSTAAARDSLQRVLDDINTHWILVGSVTGRTGLLYQSMIEALAYAFSSVDFADTAATTLNCTLSEDLRAQLARNNLMDSYETFVRLSNERYRQGLLLFPVEFLFNVQKDTASFRMPFYSMLKAVNDYLGRNFTGALQEIFKIFRVSFDAEVSARYDLMRVMINVRKGGYPAEALRLLEEAAKLEPSSPEEAGEKYRQATTLAPPFAYALFSLGKFYSRSGDPIRAQTFFERAYQTDTLYLSAYRESFNLYRRVGNYKPMIAVLVKAIQKGNNYWETYSNLGLAYMGDGDPARAIQHYERALVINPRSYTTNIQLGLAFQTVKNYQKAREYFNQAINIDPLRQEAVEYLSRLNEVQRSGK